MGVLRLSLAVAVFLYHSNVSSFLGLHVLNGSAAVCCFFVISGFYMEMILSSKYKPTLMGDSYLKRFYLARFLRLWPTYFLVVMLIVLGSIAIRFISLPPTLHFESGIGGAKLLRPIAMWLLNITGLFLNLPSSKDLIIRPGWSLGVEASFYVLAPFVLRLKTLELVGLSIAGLFLQIVPYGSHSPVLYGFHLFLLGALAYRYRLEIEKPFSRYLGSQASILYGLVFLTVLVSIPHEIRIGPAREHASNTLDCLIYPLILAVIIPLLHQRTKAHKLDQWIGHLSYPFYLVHQTVVDGFVSWNGPYKTVLLGMLILLISACLANLEVRLIEPWRSKLGRPTRPQLSAAVPNLPSVFRSAV
jgi:peptidoglycan/LPS O-acetylase OafA/YrhL